MKNYTEIQNLVDLRLKEAKILLSNNFYERALYLAGYSIELLFKGQIVKILDIPNLFDNSFKPKEFRKPYFTHDLNHLLTFSGLKNKLNSEMETNRELFKNWSLITDKWDKNCRYKNFGNYNESEVLDFITAIEDEKYGIKQWIEKQ